MAESNQRSSQTSTQLPAAPIHCRGRKAMCVCSFLSPQLAFCHSLYLATTDAMLKIKYAPKDSFKLYKAIFTLVLDCVPSPLCVNCQKVQYETVIHIAIYSKFMWLLAPTDAQKFRINFYQLQVGRVIHSRNKSPLQDKTRQNLLCV